MVFLALLLIPMLLAIGLLIFGGKKITLQEFILQMVAQCMVAGSCVVMTRCSNTADTEIWNGRVASKAQERVSCSHSYDCFCRESCSGSGSSRSCHQVCQTCYEHPNDWDWMVYTTNRESIEIDRVDRRGKDTPPRWAQVVIGEPTSVAHSYENFIKGAPDTLFRHQGLVEKYQDKLLPYPLKVFDYYRLNHLVTAVTIPEPEAWNKDLAEMNGTIGKAKQVNVIVAMVTGLPSDYAQALEQAWLGGKKNDVIVLMNISTSGIDWVYVMAWTDAEIMKIKVRDAVMGIGKLDRPAIMAAIATGINDHYVRKPMSDFKYLEASIRPTHGQWVACLLIGILVSLGLGYVFWKNDVNLLNFR